jgi:hypothetical protein
MGLLLYSAHMHQHQIKWNAAKEEWLCVKCLRTSNKTSKEEAEVELGPFDCTSPQNPKSR